MSWIKTLINAVILIAGSWICFFGALRGIYFITAIAVVALLLTHIAIVNFRVAEACIIIIAGITGSFVELINTSFGFYHYFALEEPIKILPTWIVLFWFLIGSASRHGLAVFYRNKFLLPVIGLIGGIVIYFVGLKSGALHFPPADNTSIVMAIFFWSLAIMFILLVGNKFVATACNPEQKDN